MSVVALVGAQYGSEGKGTIAYELANDFDVHVRTGAPNAGHTIRHRGHDWKMRSVPCGWVNPHAQLVIGAGALIDLDLLQDEVLQIESHTGIKIKDRLLIDPRAVVIDPIRHHQFEGGIAGEAHRLIGSTGEGVGPARMAHMARKTFPPDVAWSRVDHVADYKSTLEKRGYQLVDTAEWLHGAIERCANILLEGTQGSGLSLTHGTWPFVTSCDTNIAQMLADTGIAPLYLDEVILVARTFPIRVAGNSGPLYGETNFEMLGVEEERTTVTHKVRRIGAWDEELVKKAIRLNRPCSLAITFLDYMFPYDKGVTERNKLSEAAHLWLGEVEERLGVSIHFVGTGPSEEKFEVVRL